MSEPIEFREGQVWVPREGSRAKARMIERCEPYVRFRVNPAVTRFVYKGEFRAWIAKHGATLQEPQP